MCWAQVGGVPSLEAQSTCGSLQVLHLNKDESRELPAGRVQMIALGRGQSSDTGKEEAMCKGVMASWPAPVDMVEGLELGEAPVSICFLALS